MEETEKLMAQGPCRGVRKGLLSRALSCVWNSLLLPAAQDALLASRPCWDSELQEACWGVRMTQCGQALLSINRASVGGWRSLHIGHLGWNQQLLKGLRGGCFQGPGADGAGSGMTLAVCRSYHCAWDRRGAQAALPHD